MLMVWDLYPGMDIPTPFPSPSPSPDFAMSPSPETRLQPTAYVIPFPHPLSSIRSHPGTSKEFLVSDCHGSIFLTDWRSDPEDGDDGSLRHSSVIELIEPSALAAAAMGTTRQWSASVDWRVDAIDMYAFTFLSHVYPIIANLNSIGGVYGSKFALWDISKLRGGLPTVTGTTFAEGGQTFRYVLLPLPRQSLIFLFSWCPTYPEHFAISTQSSSKGAVLHVHNCNYVHAPPTPFVVRPKPNFIRNFDFLSLSGIPRIVASIGRTVIIFSIGVDS